MTTTGDALWMGVPVVALRGNGPVSRASFSLLSNLGLSELVASTEDEYVRIASDLANDFTRLANLRATLRGRMEASPLLDFPGFARNLEAAFRDMWQHWCAAQG
jgi:predicted O-linked N-acetylglucosamine transferase (SPINDLY family)